jgi:hypothetical protein
MAEEFGEQYSSTNLLPILWLYTYTWILKNNAIDTKI